MIVSVGSGQPGPDSVAQCSQAALAIPQKVPTWPKYVIPLACAGIFGMWGGGAQGSRYAERFSYIVRITCMYVLYTVHHTEAAEFNYFFYCGGP